MVEKNKKTATSMRAKKTNSKKAAAKTETAATGSGARAGAFNNAAERFSNVPQSPKTETDWRLEHAVVAGVVEAPDAAAVPDAIDLRENWWAVDDQGRTNSCVGWAVGNSILRWHFAKAGKITPEQLISARYIWMASKETDEFTERPGSFIEWDGTSIKTGLDVARKYGVVTDDVLPFKLDHFYEGEGSAFYALAAQLKITSYFNLDVNLGAWRQWLATKGPILVRNFIDETWWQATDNGGKLDNFQEATVQSAHACALVGYTPDRFIIRNSWGNGWGDGGFGYASLDYAAQAIKEAYGVNL